MILTLRLGLEVENRNLESYNLEKIRAFFDITTCVAKS